MASRRARRPADDPVRVEALLAAAAAALPAVLPAQRWFGGKARWVSRVSPVDAAAVPGTEGVLAIFEVAYADGGVEQYAMPVLPGPEARTFRDAMDDPTFCLALFGCIREGATVAGRHGAFRFSPTAALPAIVPDQPAQVARVQGEQSNTSVVFERAAILKLFRRLEPGPNPEYEITEYLTRAPDFREAARLAGIVVYEPEGGPTPVMLAVLQEFVASQGDAWSVTQAQLAELFAAVAGEAGEAAAPDPAFARTLAAADAKEAARLGATTGRLHGALAAAADPALAPEPITGADVDAWRAGMEAQLGHALEALAVMRDQLPASLRGDAERLVAEMPRLREGFEGLQALRDATVSKIRVHGDYHLGQVLRTAEGSVVLDFEGEPMRSLAERRAKQCALKDVAGMLRSYAYAARAALRHAVESAPDDRELPARLAPWVETWEDGVRAAFLDAYLAETRSRGVGFLPQDRRTLEAVLRAFELDKALYELGYELSHRPAWVGIPLDGLRRLVAPGPPAAPGPLRPGEGPFRFVACLELRESVGRRAEDERQLAELIEEAPLDSIYFHTHGFFLRHKFTAGAYPNDFATWVAQDVRDRALAERLAMVDPAAFPNLEALRDELAAVIDDHLRDLPIVPRVVFGEPFDFVQSRIVEIPTGIEVRTLEEFRNALLEVDLSALYYHLVEARMRLGRDRNDFAAWLDRGLGLSALAAQVRAIDPYGGSLERTRARLIQLCDETLTAAGTAG